jgi:hypothetical protein
MPTFRHLRTGRLVESTDVARYDNARWRQVSGETPQAAPAAAKDAEIEVPDGTVADLLEWVGDDPDRANAALEAEEAGKRRKGVLDALS